MIKQHFDEQGAAWKEHFARFLCSHDDTGLRKQTVKNGAIQYAYQCLTCGARTSQALSRDAAFAICGHEPAPFDVALRDQVEKKQRDSANAIRKRFDRSAFFSQYDIYLQSPQWREKRQKVLSMSGAVCAGCGENMPTQVHHLSYSHVGDEFLFELVAVCDQCHKKLHADDPPAAADEPA